MPLAEPIFLRMGQTVNPFTAVELLLTLQRVVPADETRKVDDDFDGEFQTTPEKAIECAEKSH